SSSRVFRTMMPATVAEPVPPAIRENAGFSATEDIPFARGVETRWNVFMKASLFVAVTVLGLASCQDPAARPVVAPVTVTPSPAKPAPAVKTGTVSAIDITTLFPRQQAGSALIYDARPGFVAGFGKIPGSI